MSARPIHLADLIGARVVDADGERLGHVVDLEVGARNHRVKAIELGRYGWLDRYHVLRVARRRTGQSHRPSQVAWSDVERFDGSVRLKRGAHPRVLENA